MAIGVGTAFALTRTYLLDLAPVALVLAALLGTLTGEAVTPRPVRGRGAASLLPRRVRDYAPRRELIVVALLGVGIAGFASYPIPERPDHEVKYFGTAAPVSLASTLITLGVTAALTAVIVWLIVRAPQTGVNEADTAADNAWRHDIVRRLVYTCTAVFAIVFTALAFWYADGQWDWRAGGSPVLGLVLSLLAGLGLATFACYAGALVVTPQRLQESVPAGIAGQINADRVAG
ncbi:hypothetical protein AB0C02_32910 [Micromonospora sp. NPDC048999]|uniref:hypothetical protein n=1 Tax=Micromonospora sp. NPDC048999 TaxID=3155391 RepID=UPI0033DF1241